MLSCQVFLTVFTPLFFSRLVSSSFSAPLPFAFPLFCSSVRGAIIPLDSPPEILEEGLCCNSLPFSSSPPPSLPPFSGFRSTGGYFGAAGNGMLRSPCSLVVRPFCDPFPPPFSPFSSIFGGVRLSSIFGMGKAFFRVTPCFPPWLPLYVSSPFCGASRSTH